MKANLVYRDGTSEVLDGVDGWDNTDKFLCIIFENEAQVIVPISLVGMMYILPDGIEYGSNEVH